MWHRESRGKLCAFISAVSAPRANPSHRAAMQVGLLLLGGSRAPVLISGLWCICKGVVGFACVCRAPLPEDGSRSHWGALPQVTEGGEFGTCCVFPMEILLRVMVGWLHEL